MDFALATAGVGVLLARRAFWLASSLATAASMRPDRVQAASPTAISSRRSCMPLMCLQHGMFVAFEHYDLSHSKSGAGMQPGNNWYTIMQEKPLSPSIDRTQPDKTLIDRHLQLLGRSSMGHELKLTGRLAEPP